MDLPANVLIHNEILGLKNGKGVMVAVSDQGYYEVKLQFGENTHRVLLPIAATVIIFREPEVDYLLDADIER